MARFEANLAGQPGRWSSILVRPDGTEREIEYANMRLVVDDQVRTASVFRDVTETRRLVRE
ncbi:MAG: hypothetical protein HY691_15160 [Chloroflexi bacterium]|nr:hypothetical protein [Chloroflexota bacterium]